MSLQLSTRALTRLCVLPAATTALALSLVSPASAHVGATVSDASAGAYTIATFSVPHGCDGSPTTRIEIQVPESVLAVTATRNPFYEVETTIEQLEEPVTDGHGNEVTERTASVVYTADTPLPDGQRDTFELSFQVPDAAGETLAWPTIQTCQKGETAWTQVPAEGQDADELESPAPSFEILPASGGDGHGDETAAEPAESEAEAEAVPAEPTDATGATEAEASAPTDDGSSALGWAGLVAGLLGLAAGGLALARTRTTS
ncbi:YcnI family protein [Nocardioides sp. S-58]|uniref:YcnI family protein n=1 Tax=Nocardioides renjunii TaxID=3095075 RepID=A0ABU5KED9_9ACTN|nr:YcnI family protein [Nocardioides sp. S-58]MDZ5662814.1 YcnI family protein [Nocardioides sp. S-58]